MAGTVDDMWSDQPRSWARVWGVEATAAEARGAWLTAALCWGAARFPCVVTARQQQAYARQLECYQRAVDRLPATFLRWVLHVPYHAAKTPVAVHVWRRPGTFGRSLLLISGGVDTWRGSPQH